ncbi:MAG TPA: hypothetical protein VGI81_02325 [Tepidisphaeraceae bacterium]|jgi:hypothetical protein
MRIRVIRSTPVALLVALFATYSYAEPAQTTDVKTEFMRFVDDHHGGGKLETAVATYQNDAGVTVHLVGAIHIADKSYYDGLNKTFKEYDAVLYEMVKPRNAPPPQPGEERSNSFISVVQRFMKDTLDLKFQLDAIDYTAPNFVHADLDYETFEKMEEDRGESIWSLMLQQMLRQMTNPPENQQEIGLGDLLNALTSPDRARQLKLILAKQFGDIEAQMSGFGGTVLITERNKACFKVLDKEMADGKRNLGIFYGAGHMGDMEKRLRSRGFHRTGVEWRIGWDLTEGADQADHDDAAPAPKLKAKPKPSPDDDDNPIEPKGPVKIEFRGRAR